jgi:hypothetical protein
MGKADNIYVNYNSATAAESVTISGAGMVMEPPGVLCCAVFHNSSVAGNPVQSVKADGVDMTFSSSADTLLHNVSIEYWQVDIKSLSSYAVANIVVAFTPGSVLNVLGAVFEIQQCVSVSAPIGSATNTAAVTPVTCDIGWSGNGVNAQNTVTSVPENNEYVAMAIAHKGGTLMTLNPSAGTEMLAPQNVGAGGVQFTCAMAKGTPDSAILSTFSWSESVDREWCELVVEFPSTAIVDLIQQGQPIPFPQLT